MTETLYEFGHIIGTSEVTVIQGINVASVNAHWIQTLIDAALADGVHLQLASGLRTQDEQIQLRRQNVIDKSKEGNMDWIMNADSSQFSPVTGKPGYSNHQNGRAIDISVTDAHSKANQEIDALNKQREDKTINDIDYLAEHDKICKTDPYRWLVKKMYSFGFVRTVPSERWHIEYIPGIDMFHFVPRTDPTWDGLVPINQNI